MLIRTILALITILVFTFNSSSGVAKHSFNTLTSQITDRLGVPEDYQVEIFPVAPHYVGDILSLRITYRGSQEIGEQDINLTWSKGTESGQESASFSPYSPTAVFYWILDTSTFTPGLISFHFNVPSLQASWSMNVNLLSQPSGPINRWAKVQTRCCTIHYLTHTDAEKSLSEIQATLENETDSALSQFFPKGMPAVHPLDEPLSFVLIPIVVGHGGFAADEAVLTYSEFNWAGTNFDIVSHHEIVHVLDRRLNPGPRPALLSEGLAVYLSGGHYHKGDALQRASALVTLGMYLPISEITNNFYAAQHEISYMEAAGLVSFIIERWGWDAFIDFYFNLQDGPSQFEIISTGLEEHFSITLVEFEKEFVAYLNAINPDEAVKQDVRFTVDVYDALRRYQALAIPSANILTVWWPPIEPMREEGIVGDYAKREKSPLNVILESKFIQIHADMDTKNYEEVEQGLEEINQMLDILQSSTGAISHYQIGWPIPKLPHRILLP